jgi:hypothetical protein
VERDDSDAETVPDRASAKDPTAATAKANLKFRCMTPSFFFPKLRHRRNLYRSLT